MWLALGLILAGLVIAVLGILVLWTVGRQRRDWVKRTGRVVATKTGNSDVRFQVTYDDADGQEVTFWNPFGVMRRRHLVGKTVTVLVNPVDPQDAVVEKGPARPTTAGVMFLLLGACLVAGGVGRLLAA